MGEKINNNILFFPYLIFNKPKISGGFTFSIQGGHRNPDLGGGAGVTLSMGFSNTMPHLKSVGPILVFFI